MDAAIDVLERALAAGRWAAAGRAMVTKLLEELSYEEVLAPELDGAAGAPGAPAAWQVRLPGGVRYRFRARQRLFDRLRVETGSVRRCSPEGEAPAEDPIQLLLDLHAAVGMHPATTAHLVRELCTTLVADAHLAGAPRHAAAELAELDYARIEGEMTGHPWIVANKGRIGFGYEDYLRYAPERRAPLRLGWLAAREGRASYQAVEGLTGQRLLEHELDPGTRAAFAAKLRARGLDPERCAWFPVHPWQWDHTVVPLFAADLARGDLVALGEAPDQYLPQQSIRTLSNVSEPWRFHVKLPLSVLNTLVWRGLPTRLAAAAPRVTAFLKGVQARDPFLRDGCRLVLLGEVASVAVPHPAYEALPGAPYQFRELLGCVWRESLPALLRPGERALTMASLLHLGADGRPVVQALVERSGLTPERWLAALFEAVLPPLLHFLYRYGTVFSPHGENAVLLVRDGVPAGLALKDFVDDVNLVNQPLPELEAALPPDLREVLLSEPPEWLCQFLWAGLFIGHFRYLSDLVEEHLGVPERRFWSLVRAAILAHQARFPEYRQRFELFDLLTPEFPKICLNRNRLLLDGYADRPERPHAAVHGTVRNALAVVGGGDDGDAAHPG